MSDERLVAVGEVAVIPARHIRALRDELRELMDFQLDRDGVVKQSTQRFFEPLDAALSRMSSTAHAGRDDEESSGSLSDVMATSEIAREARLTPAGVRHHLGPPTLMIGRQGFYDRDVAERWLEERAERDGARGA